MTKFRAPGVAGQFFSGIGSGLSNTGIAVLPMLLLAFTANADEADFTIARAAMVVTGRPARCSS